MLSGPGQRGLCLLNNHSRYLFFPFLFSTLPFYLCFSISHRNFWLIGQPSVKNSEKELKVKPKIYLNPLSNFFSHGKKSSFEVCTICISLKVKKQNKNMLVLYLSMLHFKSEVNGVTFKVETSENETKKVGQFI